MLNIFVILKKARVYCQFQLNSKTKFFKGLDISVLKEFKIIIFFFLQRLYAVRNAVHRSKFNTDLPWTYSEDVTDSS